MELCRVIGPLLVNLLGGKIHILMPLSEVGGASGGAGPRLPAHLSPACGSFPPSERSEEQSSLLTWPMESEGTRQPSQVIE